MEKLKQIIKEEIKHMNFKKDIPYLEPLNLIHHENGIWHFILDWEGNSIHVDITQENDSWKMSVRIKGENEGVDSNVSWGPFQGYENFVEEINRKLENNLMFLTGNLKNAKKDAEDDDIMMRIKELMSVGKELMKVEEGHLDDLKKLYMLLKKAKTMNREDAIEYLVDEFGSYNSVINTLNKISQIDFYNKMEEFI